MADRASVDRAASAFHCALCRKVDTAWVRLAYLACSSLLARRCCNQIGSTPKYVHAACRSYHLWCISFGKELAANGCREQGGSELPKEAVMPHLGCSC